jgi:hypothetical protein
MPVLAACGRLSSGKERSKNIVDNNTPNFQEVEEIGQNVASGKLSVPNPSC